ncbi:MAG: hypothetical protein UY07_C0029G0006 [Parcubacteria group bacterium GW2011_GWA1_47_8]|nr:MAG: hypothetical protein UY07_C0029G0006 [Parcubacteria group bacterium GW2011_GWA1_47_8]KKW06908.1 MAG: hypothetical protein UY42_C0021G0006 [Parcubacteria group bacterium GW2011_GWA2_49_16]
MNAIKNFLRPTKVTWWVFWVLVVVFLLSLYASYFPVQRLGYFVPFFAVELMWMFLFGISEFYYFLWGDLIYKLNPFPCGMIGGCGDGHTPTLVAYVLIGVTAVILFWFIACTISKVWYVGRNKRNNTGLVS